MTTAYAAPALRSPGDSQSSSTLFGFRASKNDRMVAELKCVEVGQGSIRVEALILSVRADESARPLAQEYTFATRDQARQFVEDAMTSLEYTGCIVEPRP